MQLPSLGNSFCYTMSQDGSDVLKFCTCFFPTNSLIQNLMYLILTLPCAHSLILLQKIGKNSYKLCKMLKFSSKFRGTLEEPLRKNHGSAELRCKSIGLTSLPLIHKKGTLPF
jgi:hypothetical protein